MRKLIYIFLLAFLLAGCRDDFARTNTQPGKITESDLFELFTQALLLMNPDDYFEWYYNHSQYYLPWTHATVAVGGNRAGMNIVGEWAQQQNKLLLPKLQTEEIRYQLEKVYTAAQAARYRNLKAVCAPITVYPGLYGTDAYGSLPYTEASTAPFTSPAIITPRYQAQQQLLMYGSRNLTKR